MNMFRAYHTTYYRRSVGLVFTAVTLTVMICFVALSVDVGYTLSVKAQLQRTADAAAMAAAGRLTNGEGSLEEEVSELAKTYSEMNKAGGLAIQLEESDIVLGRAVFDENGKCVFEANEQPYDSVRVTARLTSGSPNGPLGLFFGGALGASTADVAASATATLIPRDIAVVIDLSNSMSYDSQLRHESTDINIREVWQDLGSPQFGNMQVFHNSASEMTTYSSNLTTNTIINNLGLNNVAYPYSGGTWSQYVSFVKGHSVSAYKNRYGLRTFVDFLLEKNHLKSQTPALAQCRVQPMHAVKQAVEELCNYLTLLNSGDLISLHTYTEIARQDCELTSDYTQIIQATYDQQAGGYGTFTNIGDGINNAVAELTSSRARPTAKKVIFILTDGNANRPTSETVGRQHALAMAEDAASLGIQIFTVTLGTTANQDLMRNIAATGKGTHYHIPTFSIEQYEEDLKTIFRTLGGKRPIRLIE